MAVSESLAAHLATGHTTLARCWRLERQDGVVLGFTDHDRDLFFEETVFRADTGLTAQVLSQGAGLSVDNSEALGALSDASISETDIVAGRFDGARCWCWLVNWEAVSDRLLLFAGTLGDLVRAGGAFQAELRGLTEPLNHPVGRVYQKACAAVLGDGQCQVDLSASIYQTKALVESVDGNRVFRFSGLDGFEDGWFRKGRLDFEDGAAAGLYGVIKEDRIVDGFREIALWAPIALSVELGTVARLTVGCDKRFQTCRLKFLNHLNFQGFPDIPGDDWITIGPSEGAGNDGGSLR